MVSMNHPSAKGKTSLSYLIIKGTQRRYQDGTKVLGGQVFLNSTHMFHLFAYFPTAI